MKILCLVNNENACDYHRISNPLMSMPSENGDRLVFRSSDEYTKKSNFKDADIVVLNRHPFFDINVLFELKKEFKFKLWVDVDDHWKLPTWHYLRKAWNEHKTSDKITECMKNADVVTVTNDRLREKALEFNSNVVVLPNSVPYGHSQFKARKTESTKLRFVYTGGPSHYYDIKSLSNAIDMIKRSHDINRTTSFTLAGFNPTGTESVWYNMENVFRHLPGYNRRKALSLFNYMEHYDHADISIAPLEDNEFNSYKSNLKVIEAGCMRMPIIVSAVYPYLEDLEMADNGIVFCKTPGQWYDAVEFFAAHPNEIIEHGENLYNYVFKKYNMDDINKKRREIINNLIGKNEK